MGRILGLDAGERRIGLAVSDPDGRLAVPLRVLERRDERSDIASIAEITREEQVERLVVGLPRSLSGAVGEQAKLVEAFARRVAEACDLPLAFWDERLTSVQAERSQAPTAARRGRKRRNARRRPPADDLAAALILQGYLDRHRREETPADS